MAFTQRHNHTYKQCISLCAKIKKKKTGNTLELTSIKKLAYSVSIRKS